MKKYQELVIFRPNISSRITQDWGENRACIRNDGSVYGVPSGRCPGQSVYESFGMKGHNGIDIGGFKGEEIYHAATFPGWWKADHDSRGGLGVDVVSNEPLFFPFPIPPYLTNTAIPHEQNGEQGFLHFVKMRYWHLSHQVGHAKKRITLGTVVGLMGNTGISSGVHLHFAPKWCDIHGGNVARSNGYYGAFDPRPFYTHRATAKEHSDMIVREALPLSQKEIKDIRAQLSLAQKLLLSIQKLSNLI